MERKKNIVDRMFSSKGTDDFGKVFQVCSSISKSSSRFCAANNSCNGSHVYEEFE